MTYQVNFKILLDKNTPKISYMETVPIEIPALIISKLKHFYVRDFIEILGEVYSPKFINAWKVIAGDMFYNPVTMQLTEHPLIINLFNEFAKLKYGNLIGATNNMRIFQHVNWITFSESLAGNFTPRVRIDTSFNIYSRTGNKSRGNLYDKPWNGFDTIDSSGVIVNQSKLKTRLRELEGKK